ncbi:MAG: PqqD family peptide modification chaperone [Pseudomonadota bacterium]
MNELTPETVVCRGAEHVETRVGSQTLMMSVTQGKYFSVDATGNRIWDLIEQPISVQQIVATLRTEYNVGADECEAQVKSFIGELIANGLAVEH